MRQALSLAVLGVVALAVTTGVHVATNQLALAQPAVPVGGQVEALAPIPTRVGLATFYGDEFQGLLMADGTPFDVNVVSAASNSWPLGTTLRLRRAPGSPWENTLPGEESWQYFNRTVDVEVRDRGAFSHALDLSPRAFSLLGRPEEGVIRVLIEVVSTPSETTAQ